MKTISNDLVTVTVEDHGAEMSSIRCGGREYLWGAYPEFWKRHSPVLFPIVGSVWNGEYRSKGQTYKMGQHGFARDMDFVNVNLNSNDNEAWYELRSNEETQQKYPYPFVLRIGYRLHDKTIDVCWEVENPSDQEIAFQIGAHPAFYWPMLSNETIEGGVEAMNKRLAQDKERGYFLFEPAVSELKRSRITEGGCVDPAASTIVKTDEGYLALSTDTFSTDALVIENSQVKAVTLCDNEKRPYLTLKFDAPLVGLWSSPGKNAPFVCIEPWYGRCDRVHYDGTYEEKEWVNRLAPHKTFSVKYEIIIE